MERRLRRPLQLREIKKEIRELAADRERALEKIQRLEKRVEQLESENAQIKATNAQIKTETVQTTEQVKTLQQSVEQGPESEGMAKAFQGYLGSHTFTLTGAAGIDFIADQQSGALAGLSSSDPELLLPRFRADAAVSPQRLDAL